MSLLFQTHSVSTDQLHSKISVAFPEMSTYWIRYHVNYILLLNSSNTCRKGKYAYINYLHNLMSICLHTSKLCCPRIAQYSRLKLQPAGSASASQCSGVAVREYHRLSPLPHCLGLPWSHVRMEQCSRQRLIPGEPGQAQNIPAWLRRRKRLIIYSFCPIYFDFH